MQNSRNHPIDCGLATTDPFSRQFAKQTIANRSANIVYNQINRVTDPINPTNIQYGDLNVLRYDQGQAVTDFEISIEPNAGRSPFLKSIQSSNESILANTLENPLLFTFVNNGQCVINTELQNGEKYAQLLKTETLNEYQYDVFQSFVDGSLIKAINDSTLPFLDNSTSPLGHYAYYSTYNSANTFVKNPSCWLADLDLSGTCVLTAGGNTRMCSMITPYFAVGVRHFEYHPRVGESVVFCTPQNESITRIVESIHYLPRASEPPFYDFSLIKFTQPVPENIKKYKLFPPNSINYFPINHTFNRFFLVTEPPTQEYYSMRYCPIVGVSHYRWDSEYQGQRNNRFIYLCETTSADFQNIISSGINFNLHQTYPNYNSGYAPSNDAYSPAFRGGDSGGPVFAILNGDLILLGAHLSGVSILHFGSIKNQIQDLINSIGPIGQSIQTVDVSGFTDFSS